MIAISQRHFKAGTTVAGYEEAVTARLHIVLEQVSHTAMRHYLGDMLFMVSAVGLFGNPKLRAGFSISPWHDTVEPLFITVDPQYLLPRLQSPSLLHSSTKFNLFFLVLGCQTRLDVLSIDAERLMRVKPSGNAAELAPMVYVATQLPEGDATVLVDGLY
jgi:hypothetical protein